MGENDRVVLASIPLPVHVAPIVDEGSRYFSH